MAATDTDTDTDDKAGIVRLNVGGTLFQTTWPTLAAVRNTRLSDLSTTSVEWRQQRNEFFFDRDPSVFAYILSFYRTGELHLPNWLCASAIQKELQFWEISETHVWNCCWKHLYKAGQLQRMKRELNDIFADHSPLYYDKLRARFRGCRLEQLRWALWTTLEKPDYSRASKIWFIFYISLLVLSTTTLFLQTLPSFRNPIPKRVLIECGIYNNDTNHFYFPVVTSWILLTSPKLILLMTTRPLDWLTYVGMLCLCVFTVDFLLRFLVSRVKCEFCRRVMNWLDLIILVAEWLGFVVMNSDDHAALARVGELCRLLSYFRFFRFYRLLWKSDELRVLKLCLKNCQKELLMLFFLAMAASAGFAILAYVVEIGETGSFRNLPLTLWWAIITLTSVGYGDVVPASYQGRFISGLCAVSGMLLVALPVAVIATNFGEYHALYREMLALVQRKNSEIIGQVRGPEKRKMTLRNIFLKNKVESLKKW